MSSTIVLQQSKAIHMLTDGNVTESLSSDSRTIGRTSKVWTLPHINAAIAFRGGATYGPILQTLFALGAQSFDHLRENPVEIIRDARQAYDKIVSLPST